jgi:hypothetical protein
MGTEGEVNSLIYRLFTLWFPDWEAPPHKREWNICLCPWHDETRPSSRVNYRAQAFVCSSCEVRGDAIKLIQYYHKEYLNKELTFAEAVRYAEEISGRSFTPVQSKSGRKPSRGVPSKKRTRWS